MADVHFLCPECGNPVSAPSVYRGREVDCLSCDAKVRVPVHLVADESVSSPDFIQLLIPVLLGILGLVLVGGFILTRCAGEKNDVAARDEERVAMERDLPGIVRVWVKRRFADPDAEIMDMSFDYGENQDIALSLVSVRGRNTLGGYVINSYELEIDRAMWRVVGETAK